ncbi:MAG: BlaI/MecI/CopY family transcriptional regulator [Ginsengibacter sp.]
MTKGINIKPTESELEIMQILWQKKSCTVREVHEILEKTKPVGYTSTLKLMQIMHEKGLVARDTTARTHIYTPLLNQEKTQKQLVQKMVKDVFNGSAANLVMQALGNHKTNPEEIEQIKTFLDQLKTQ